MAKKKVVKPVVHMIVNFVDGPVAFCDDDYKPTKNDVVMGEEGNRVRFEKASEDDTLCPACIHAAKWHHMGYEQGAKKAFLQMTQDLIGAMSGAASDPEANTRARSSMAH